MNIHSSKGYGMIEVIIAISILGILMGLSITGYQYWVKNARVRQVAESVLSGLQSARLSAIASNSSITFTMSNNGWRAESDPDQVFGLQSKVVGSENWSAGAKGVVILGTQDTIKFNGVGMVLNVPPGGATFDISSSSPSRCQTASNKNGVRCLSIQIKQFGQPRLCDPLLSLATNPQGCV